MRANPALLIFQGIYKLEAEYREKGGGERLATAYTVIETAPRAIGTERLRPYLIDIITKTAMARRRRPQCAPPWPVRT